MATARRSIPPRAIASIPNTGRAALLSDRGQGDRSSAATGRALLALAADAMPDAEDLAGLRRALRRCCCTTSAGAA